MSSVSRRTALKLAAALPVSAAFGKSNNSDVLTTLDYSQVELLDGPLKRQFDQNHKFFLTLNEDRMLKIYRQRVGLPAPGPNMGGWYDDFCPGASFGQYVSGLARFAAATDSEETRAKVKRLVRGYAETVDPAGKFFADLRYPAYTYDKLVCGLIDAHSLARDSSAVAVLAATTRAALPHMPEKALTAEEKEKRPHKDETYLWDETYTLAENLFLANQITGEKRYSDMARNYLPDRGFLDPLAEGQDILPGLHAYSHVNALSSGMQGYLRLNDPKYLRAVTNAVSLIWKNQSFATGGWGPNESFVTAGKGELGASLDTTHRSFETPCGSYAHLKVMRYLLRVSRDARYGDSMERVIYNTLLGAKPILEDGSSFYYSDYHHAGFKTYKRVIPGATYAWDLDDKWPCCSGTLPQATADYGINSYLRSADGVYVNLYHPSRVTWSQDSARCTLTQKTDYPQGRLITAGLSTSAPVAFTVYLRIPAWAGKNTQVAVNGRRLQSDLTPGAFFPIQRTWKNGDRIELEIDQPVRFEAIDMQTPNQIAIVRGPQVLFAIQDQQPRLASRDLQTLKRANGDDWSMRTSAGILTLRPFVSIGNEHYHTYSALI
jgi:DUF1680 family protein